MLQFKFDLDSGKTLASLLICFSLISTIFVYQNHLQLAYGDAESHINIAKRVVSGLTPGLSQLGGVWLPFSHILMLPFVVNDWAWRTGIAGSVVSMVGFVLMGVWFYKLLRFLGLGLFASVVGLAALCLNPNTLYMQATPMTESIYLALIVGSVYFFVRWWRQGSLQDLMATSILLCFATLTRYESWMLALVESALIIWRVFTQKEQVKLAKSQALLVVHGVLAYAGIALWLGWCLLIFNSPLYFTRSEYSAASQQRAFDARGQLVTHNSWSQSLVHMLAATHENFGTVFSILVIASIFLLVFYRNISWFTFVLLSAPTAFLVLSLYLGQTIILIPGLSTFGGVDHLFNARYGMTALPIAGYLLALVVHKLPKLVGALVLVLLIIGYAHMFIAKDIITLRDATTGFSAAIPVPAESYLKKNYAGGLVLLDDYAHTISIIRSGLRMQDVIYVGNKPYWEDSLSWPDKHATWVVTGTGDEISKRLESSPDFTKRLTKFFSQKFSTDTITIYSKKTPGEK